jgi:hypothetical protein
MMEGWCSANSQPRIDHQAWRGTIMGREYGFTSGRVICYGDSGSARPHERHHLPQRVLGPFYLPVHGAMQAASAVVSAVVGPPTDASGAPVDAYAGYDPLEWGPYSHPGAAFSGPPAEWSY